MSPRIIIFASGTKDNGGSGFENLVEASRTGVLDAEIVAVISNHEHGGVRERADRLGVKFTFFPGPYDAEHYSSILQNTRIDWVALSGWYKHVKGLDPRRTFNIHPALLSQLGGPSPRHSGLRPREGGRFGGKGMYGQHIHEAVKAAFEADDISESGFTMHFVTEELDRGPAFFEYRIPLKQGMTADEIRAAVQSVEHEWQPKITNMVVHGEIAWDGRNPKSLVVPDGYQYLPKR